MLTSPNTPLKVALLSISPHNRAILEFFFAGAGKKIFQTVNSEQAEALIVDFDHPGARQEWQDATMHAKPAIVLSVRETTEDNTVWVPKPLTSQSLADAANRIRNLLPTDDNITPEQTSPSESTGQQENNRDIDSLRALLDSHKQNAQPFGISKETRQKQVPKTTAQPAQPRTREPLVRPELQAATKVEKDDLQIELIDPDQQLRTEDVYIPPPLADEEIPESDSPSVSVMEEEASSEEERLLQEQRWEQLCGNYDEKLTLSDWHSSSQVYVPENFFLNSLIDALKLSQQSRQYVQIQLEDEDYALLMPDVNLAYFSIDLHSEQFATLCNIPLSPGQVKLHLPSSTELQSLQETVQHDAQHTYDMEALIWTTSLLTSQGRLSRNADMNQKLRLKFWPNLTRLEQFPHVMRVAATWQQHPGTVFDLTEQLAIPQRYIISFYNAAHTLGLFTFDQGKPQSREKPAPKKNRGLFSRILKRLLGGG